MKTTCPLGTHYHPESGLVFDIEKCETCGGPVRSVNSVVIKNPGLFNLVYVSILPAEQSWDEKCCCVVCDNCKEYSKDSEFSEKVKKYLLETYEGKKLLKTHLLDEEGIWRVLGEDPNCDLGGYHSNPHLATYEGKLLNVLEKAVTLPNFYTWGSGGKIEKVSVESLND